MSWTLCVRDQRFPWAASYVAAIGFSQVPAMVGGWQFQEATTSAALVVLGATLASHLVAHAHSPSGRLSALALGNLSAAFCYDKNRGALEFREPEDILRFRRPSSLSDRQWERIRDRVEDYLAWQVDRELRGH